MEASLLLNRIARDEGRPLLIRRCGLLDLSWPSYVHLLKANHAVASEGMIVGSAEALIIGTEFIGGTAFIRRLGSLRVSDGISGYMFLSGEGERGTLEFGRSQRCGEV
jgi:hypothetical protein